MGKATLKPPKEQYKTKAQIVAYIKKSFEDCAAIQNKETDWGKPAKLPFMTEALHPLSLWSEATAHAGEHYGSLVVYYRLQGMVPPESRPRK